MESGTLSSEQRLVALEEKLEYQEYTLEKLNEVIISQQRQLDSLEVSLQNVREKMQIQELELDGTFKEIPPPRL